MDIIEFAEKVLGVELNEWEKKILVELAAMPPDRKVLILPPKRNLYYNGTITLYQAMIAERGNTNG